MLNQLQFKTIMDKANSINNNCKQITEIDSCKFVIKKHNKRYVNSWLETT